MLAPTTNVVAPNGWIVPNGTSTTGLVQSAYSPNGAYTTAGNASAAGYYNINPQAVQQVPAQGGGPNLLSVANQGRSIINNGFSLPQSQFVNSIGGSLGFASTAPAATYTGVAGSLPWQTAGALAPTTGASTTLPWLAGGVEQAGTVTQGAGVFGSGIGGASTLSGTLGAAGLGALAGNFLGKIGGNSTSGSIGGGLGAGIGMAVGGPVGAVIGGAIGGIAGGFFGNKSKPTQSDTYGALITESGGLGQGGATGKNAGSYAGFGKSNLTSFSSMAQAASKDLGIKWDKSQQVNAGISTLHGGAYFDFGLPNEGPRERFTFNQKDPKSSQEAAAGMLKALAKKSGYTDTAALDAWIAKNSAGQSAGSGVQIPIQNKQKFDDFIAKFKTEGNTNGNGSNAPNVPTTTP